MFEFTYPSIPDVKAYLKRIGLDYSPEPTYENLNLLIRAHQCAIPFDNLNCSIMDMPVDTSIPVLFDKVVLGHRGGYCYELNALFLSFLKGLGYDAYACMCRVSVGRDYLAPVSHRGTIVRLDGRKYFCDVGFGGPMAPFAVEISEAPQTLFNETYWFTPGEEGWFALNRIMGKGIGDTGELSGQNQVIMFVGPQPFLSEDYYGYNLYSSTAPESLFLNKVLINRRLPDGFRSLTNNVYKELTGGVKTTRTIDSSELFSILKNQFDIIIPEAPEYLEKFEKLCSNK